MPPKTYVENLHAAALDAIQAMGEEADKNRERETRLFSAISSQLSTAQPAGSTTSSSPAAKPKAK